MSLEIISLDQQALTGRLDDMHDVELTRNGERIHARIATWTQEIFCALPAGSSALRSAGYEAIAKFRQTQRRVAN